MATVWPTGGCRAARAAMPYRSVQSLQYMAIRMNLRCIKGNYHSIHGKYVSPYKSDPAVDGEIERGYQEGLSAETIARKLERTRSYVLRRAYYLGLTKPMARNPKWEEKEIEMACKHSGRSFIYIQRILKLHGYKRSLHAIKTMLAKQKMPSTGDLYTAASLSRLMRVSENCVKSWIHKGWLYAEKGKHHSTNLEVEDKLWQIHPYDVKKFIIDNLSMIDVGRCDKYWMFDLLLNHTLKLSTKELAKRHRAYDRPEAERGLSEYTIHL